MAKKNKRVVDTILEGALKLADGLITIEMHNPHIREGVVIRPLEERVDLNGRVILKVISDDYITRKGGTEYH